MPGKYQAYPEYKDSGVGWLGKIPIHWGCTQIKYGYEVTLGKMLQKEQKVSTDKLRPYLKAINVQPAGVSLIDVNEMWFSEADIHSLRLKDGDVLISEGGDVGRAAIWRSELEECYIQNALNRARPIKKNSSRFLYYWMNTLKNSAYIEVTCNKATIAHYTAEKVESSPLLLPTEKEEAENIANFLDHETAKIDTLIDKQQQLIKLLKEKRQAVISHAVTKGLNPDAPMRDSCVEWLGEVPEHWVVTRAKHLFNFVTSGSRGWAEYYSDKGSLFFRIANLTRDTVDPKLESIQLVMPPEGSEGERSKIKFDDILISITADLGSVCVADHNVAGGYVSQHVSLCRPNSKVANSRWLGYVVLSDGTKEQFGGAGYGGTKIQLSLEDIREFWVAKPPEEEQVKLARHIDEKLDQFAILISKAELQISLLQERRTALISAAVTGKIDVRNWQAPEQKQTNKEEAA